MDNALPYDDATENVVLGSVIANTGEYEVVSRYFTDINVFHQRRARLLWIKIKEMKRSGQNVDTLTVCTSLTKKDIDRGLDRYYITGCTAEPCLRGATEVYASRLYEKYLMRKVIVQADEIKKQASDNNKNIYKTISETHSILSELLENRPTKASDINDVINETVDSIKNKTDKLIKTG